MEIKVLLCCVVILVQAEAAQEVWTSINVTSNGYSEVEDGWHSISVEKEMSHTLTESNTSDKIGEKEMKVHEIHGGVPLSSTGSWNSSGIDGKEILSTSIKEISNGDSKDGAGWHSISVEKEMSQTLNENKTSDEVGGGKEMEVHAIQGGVPLSLTESWNSNGKDGKEIEFHQIGGKIPLSLTGNWSRAEIAGVYPLSLYGNLNSDGKNVGLNGGTGGLTPDVYLVLLHANSVADGKGNLGGLATNNFPTLLPLFSSGNEISGEAKLGTGGNTNASPGDLSSIGYLISGGVSGEVKPGTGPHTNARPDILSLIENLSRAAIADGNSLSLYRNLDSDGKNVGLNGGTGGLTPDVYLLLLQGNLGANGKGNLGGLVTNNIPTLLPLFSSSCEISGEAKLGTGGNTNASPDNLSLIGYLISGGISGEVKPGTGPHTNARPGILSLIGNLGRAAIAGGNSLPLYGNLNSDGNIVGLNRGTGGLTPDGYPLSLLSNFGADGKGNLGGHVTNNIPTLLPLFSSGGISGEVKPGTGPHTNARPGILPLMGNLISGGIRGLVKLGTGGNTNARPGILSSFGNLISGGRGGVKPYGGTGRFGLNIGTSLGGLGLGLSVNGKK